MANRVVTFNHTATGGSSGFRPQGNTVFNIALSGDGVGTVKIEKSFDDGVSWVDVSRDAAGTLGSFDKVAGGEFCVQAYEPEDGVLYRTNCTAFTSGTIAARMSQ